MPLYKFGLDENCCLLDDATEWHPDDVAALRLLAQFTADLDRKFAIAARAGPFAPDLSG